MLCSCIHMVTAGVQGLSVDLQQNRMKQIHLQKEIEEEEEEEEKEGEIQRCELRTQSVRGLVVAEAEHVLTLEQAPPTQASHVAAAVSRSSVCRESTVNTLSPSPSQQQPHCHHQFTSSVYYLLVYHSIKLE